jgi:hypothetical protein
MISTFSYPLPDELYVEGVSGNITGTFTYDGPETFDVQIDGSGDVLDIDIQNEPELGPDFRKTIDATKQPEVAYMFAHYFDENYIAPVSETVDEVMENSDVYKKPLNPDLTTAYQVKYNTQENDFELLQIVKQQDNPSALEAQRRKENIQKYADKYSFGTEVDDAIETYITALNTFIANNPPLKTWKYINFNLNSVPKIPASIAIELSKIPSEGV